MIYTKMFLYICFNFSTILVLKIHTRVVCNQLNHILLADVRDFVRVVRNSKIKKVCLFFYI